MSRDEGVQKIPNFCGLHLRVAPKAVSDWMECERSPDISRVDVFPCLSDYAGTDSAVRLALQSERELCFTNVLDNNGNDLARGWKNSYRQVKAT